MLKVRRDFYNQEKEKGNHVSCPGDPPHAVQLIIKQILDLPLFQKVVVNAQSIGKAFKNTRCKQFLKVQMGLDENSRFGILF
jgi:hypothetical protein